MPEATAWSPFFTAQVGASAALAGLVIVAVSINLQRILSLPALTGRAGETLVLLVGALVLSSVMLMPAGPVMLGGAAVVVSALVWSACLVIHIGAVSQAAGGTRGLLAARIALTQLTTLAMVAGSAFLLAGNPAGFFWLAAAALFAIVGAVMSTWVLLVEILR